MAENLATRAPLPASGIAGTFEVVRAEALFASTLQPSGSASSDQVRRVVATTLRRLGAGGCAARMAVEFGDHPDTAGARMTWALAMVSRIYPESSLTAATGLRPLAFAG
jgi:hypothetical protein